MAEQNNTKKLSFLESYSISMGFVIGVGIITMTGVAIGYTGVGVILAYILAGIALLIIETPKMLAASVVPKTSMSYLMAGSLNPRFAGVMVYIFVLQIVSTGLMSVTFITYLSDIVPLPINGSVLAICLLGIFFTVNLFGAKNVALVQTLLNIILICAWGTYLFFGLPKADYSLITIPNMLPNGLGGMLSAIAMLSFAMGGGTWALESAGRVENPTKNIVKINLASTGTAMILFALIAVVASCVLPVSDVAFKSLSLVAREIYPGNLYLLFIIGGALIAIITTLNAAIMNCTNGIYRSTKDGWFPSVFSKENKHNMPYVLMGLLFIVACIPVALGFDTTLLSRITSGVNLLGKLLPALGCYFFLKNNNELWKNSKFYMSDKKLITIIAICTTLILILIVNTIMSYTMPVAIGVAVVLVVMLIISSVRTKVYKTILQGRTDEEDAKIV